MPRQHDLRRRRRRARRRDVPELHHHRLLAGPRRASTGRTPPAPRSRTSPPTTPAPTSRSPTSCPPHDLPADRPAGAAGHLRHHPRAAFRAVPRSATGRRGRLTAPRSRRRRSRSRGDYLLTDTGAGSQMRLETACTARVPHHRRTDRAVARQRPADAVRQGGRVHRGLDRRPSLSAPAPGRHADPRHHRRQPAAPGRPLADGSARVRAALQSSRGSGGRRPRLWTAAGHHRSNWPPDCARSPRQCGWSVLKSTHERVAARSRRLRGGVEFAARRFRTGRPATGAGARVQRAAPVPRRRPSHGAWAHHAGTTRTGRGDHRRHLR